MSARRWARWASAVGALLALLLAVGSVAAQEAEPPPSPEALEIARTLKCLVCQNQSVADSPSPLAQEMRAYIARRLAAGDSREAIVRDLVERYGEEILLEPPRAGFTALVWWLPVVSLVVGALAVALTLRPWQRSAPAADPLPLAAELARREGERA
jgi:cytochrome c-type biogenesis protein CcmH